MIKVEMTDLPVEKIKKIQEWLDKEECAWLEQCVTAEIAEMQVKATNLPLSEPHRTIGDPNAIPPESVDLIKKAAVLQTFIDVLTKKRDKESVFRTARLTI